MIRPIVFLGIAIAIWCGMHVYVFSRVASVPLVARFVPPRALLAVAIVLWASFPASFFVDHLGPQVLARPVSMLGMNWLGVLFIALCCFVLVDLVTGFGFLLTRLVPTLRAAGLVAAGVLSVVALVQGLRPPVVSEHEVRLAGLPADADGLVVVAVSDTHVGSMTSEEWLADRAEQVRALGPDAIVLLGDVIEGDSPNERSGRLVPILRRFSAPLGTWAVTGNHEFFAGVENAVRLFEEADIQVLRGRWAEVRPGLALAGIDDPGRHHMAGDEPGRIGLALAGRPADAATILLSHRPERAEEAARAGVDLMLSGHTHGGQIWPFDWVSRLASPLLEGRYEVAGMPVIVCRGSGTWGPRMRLWAPSEILRITLRTRRGDSA